MKKLIAIFSVFLLSAVLLTGCGTTEKAATTAPEAQDQNHTQGDNAASAPGDAGFREYPIGEPIEIEGMNIAAVYLQPVTMEPAQKAGLAADKSDVHLEADISALENNALGFGAGEFVPYLTVKFKLVNKDTGETQEGSFMPMNAGDGSHYGANIKMMGAGNYALTYIIDSPEKQDFLIHTDKATGVPGKYWKKAIEAAYEFSFIPRKW